MRNKTNKFINKLPLFLSILLAFNGLLSILVAILPLLQYLNFTSYTAEISKYIIGAVPIKYNTIILVVLGYFLLTLSRGLYLKKYLSWWLAFLTLLILLINSTVVSHTIALLDCIYIFELVLLLLSRNMFKSKIIFWKIDYSQIMVIVSFIMACLYGIFGSYILKDEFVNLHNIYDAIYFTIITFSTVGYGDITPITSTARLFVTSMVFIGLGTFAAVLTVLINAVVGRMQSLLTNMKKGKIKMKTHTIICGASILSEQLIKSCENNNIDFLVVISKLNANYFDEQYEKNIVIGSPGDNDTWKNCSTINAKNVILSYESDAENILALISIKQLCEKQKNKPNIIIHINHTYNIEKAKILGANNVIAPLNMATNAIENIIL